MCLGKCFASKHIIYSAYTYNEISSLKPQIYIGVLFYQIINDSTSQSTRQWWWF